MDCVALASGRQGGFYFLLSFLVRVGNLFRLLQLFRFLSHRLGGETATKGNRNSENCLLIMIVLSLFGFVFASLTVPMALEFKGRLFLMFL